MWAGAHLHRTHTGRHCAADVALHIANPANSSLSLHLQPQHHDTYVTWYGVAALLQLQAHPPVPG